MAIQLVLTPEVAMAIFSLVKSGVELIGEFTDEQLIQMAKDEEARSDRLQDRQERGQ